MCCRTGSVLAAVVIRRCNLNTVTFKFFSEPLVKEGFISKSVGRGGQVFYATSRRGLDFVRCYRELQGLCRGLEPVLGVLV